MKHSIFKIHSNCQICLQLTANIYQLREFNAPEKRSRYIFANRVCLESTPARVECCTKDGRLWKSQQ